MDGKNAAKVARQTGVPLARVQLMFHKVNGKDPAEASSETARRRARSARAGEDGLAASARATPGVRRGR
jgi:hypothetical protein